MCVNRRLHALFADLVYCSCEETKSGVCLCDMASCLAFFWRFFFVDPHLLQLGM